mmetsp:Transcript_26191/g.61443  ORF Transcript_26191/g.61443 Transcript_26191/m.61443 type:complete len:205 (-) Transcript_26191:282-896(-)
MAWDLFGLCQMILGFPQFGTSRLLLTFTERRQLPFDRIIITTDQTFIMSYSSRFARTLGRRVLASRFQTKVAAPQLGAVRHSSYFTPSHEYLKVEGDIGTCGITDVAQTQLGDIVYVELPGVGDEFEAGDSFGSVESVKAASDVYAPVSGTVVEVNEVLEEQPDIVNSSAEDAGWFIKIKMNDTSEVNKLLDATGYAEIVAEEQ